VARKDGVPDFPPKIHEQMFFEKGDFFREYLLAKGN
jgi:hypothetical protein